MRRRVMVIGTMMTVVAVVIECCHACTTRAARNFHKWWILSLWSSILQSNKLRTDKTETSHPIPFSNVCFTHLSSNLILKKNIFDMFFSWYIWYNYNIPSSLMYPLVSVNLKNRSPVFGSPDLPGCPPPLMLRGPGHCTVHRGLREEQHIAGASGSGKHRWHLLVDGLIGVFYTYICWMFIYIYV